MKQIIRTHLAPKVIGTYSQAVKAGNTVYISGQIPLVTETMELISTDIRDQIKQVFENLSQITEAAGGNLSEIVRLTIYLTDITHFQSVNEIMSEYFEEPYPARVLIGVAALPKQSQVEVDAIMVLSD
ncbi:MAG: RidA family protein [Gammaproteobacteria bacterium]|nr:RidA family protein [Gammaproteobacteria bacterium]